MKDDVVSVVPVKRCSIVLFIFASVSRECGARRLKFYFRFRSGRALPIQATILWTWFVTLKKKCSNDILPLSPSLYTAEWMNENSDLLVLSNRSPLVYVSWKDENM